MPVLAHGRTPQQQQLGFAIPTQKHLKSSYPELYGHGPALSSSGGA